MKKSKKLTTVVNKVNDKFLDIEKPVFDWVDVSLEWTNTAINNSEGQTVEQSNEFVVVFNLSKKMNSENKELSEEIKSITGMSFAPYRWEEKSYRFYTTKYNTRDDAHKKEVLLSLFDAVKDFEVKRNKELEMSVNAFKDDLKVKQSYNTDLLAMKFCEEKNTFVVVTKGYIGKEAFRKILSSSSKTFKWGEEGTEKELPDGFFDDLNILSLKNKMVFILNPNGYLSIKDMFEGEKNKVDNFIKEQDKVLESGIDIAAVEYTDENEFDFKIKYNAEKKCFEFYAKGYNSNYKDIKYEEEINQYYQNAYNSPYPTGVKGYGPSKKSVLSMLSLNYICSEPDPEYKDESNMKISLDKASFMYNKKFVMLDILKGSDAKSKVLYVPLTDYDKLKAMKERFLKLNEVFSLPDVKVTAKSAQMPAFQDIPMILFNKDLNPVLVYSIRQSGTFTTKPIEGMSGFQSMMDIDDVSTDTSTDKEQKKPKPYRASIIGKPISFEKAMYYLHDHELSEEIRSESKSLNAYFHAGDGLKGLDAAEQEDVFNKVLLMAKIHAENPEKVVKKRSNKI